MNPEVSEDSERLVAARVKRVGTRLHRRLQESISESRMLQVLDRSLEVDRSLHKAQIARLSRGFSNQNQSQKEEEEEEEEEELVCVSTMVAVEPEGAQKEPQQRVGGVIKTVRQINRERGDSGATPPRENQSESAEDFK